MRYLTLTLALVVLVYLNSCVSSADNQRPANTRTPKPITVLRPVPAVLTGETYPPADVSETKIKGKAGEPFEFKHAQFVDEHHGWAMTAASLYRTTDGGKSWERLSQEPEKDARFSSFFFIDESRGWLTVWKHIFTERYGLGNSSVIMVTDDGGRSWKPQASFPNEVTFSEIRFLNRNEGLAVGATVIDAQPPYAELLVLSTENSGKDWKNISEPAKEAIKNEYGIPNDNGTHIYWTNSSIFLLTQYGQIISTTDRGKTWKHIATFKDERPNGFASSTGFIKLAPDPEGKLRMIAAAKGDEGYWGDLVVNEDGRWTSYEVLRTPIFDAVFLSNKELLASGLNVRPELEEFKHLPEDGGVILRSIDVGKNWQTVYRTKTFETFFFLDKIKDNEFCAVSDTGTFVRFTLRK